MRTPRDQQFLFCIQLSLLLLLPFPHTHTHTHTRTHTHAHAHIKHLIHTNVLSAASVRRRLPLHHSIRRGKTSERKRKKEVTKFAVKTTSSVFKELIEGSWIFVSATELFTIYKAVDLCHLHIQGVNILKQILHDTRDQQETNCLTMLEKFLTRQRHQ